MGVKMKAGLVFKLNIRGCRLNEAITSPMQVDNISKPLPVREHENNGN